MKTIGIAQPTYLPWLGYFDLIDQVDEFVLLDDVQFERHSWQHRNRVKGPGGEIMLVVPVRRSGLETPLCEATIADVRELGKHRKTLVQAYARADHRDEVLGLLEPSWTEPPERLVDLTSRLIRLQVDLLGIETPIVCSSSLDVQGAKDDLVRSICDALDADTYLAVAGSRQYMSDGRAFDDEAVDVRYHEFQCLPHAQLHGEFLSHLSAIDALMCVGPSSTRQLLVDGRK